LIQAVNDEFGITKPPPARACQGASGRLNAFLMEKKGPREKAVVLVIDEAQNLGRDVLEQVRLLSNLETTRSKLLQIILVGQPELSGTARFP
jgi:general secretion pathway protein A